MDHLDVPQTLGLLVVMLAAAKLFGFLAQRIGQPAVLGELVAGVVLGMSVLGFVNPTDEVLHLLAEIGVVILLFEIGLETDLRKLVQVGGESALVAIVGVALPFALGYLVCRSLGLGNLVAVVAGATLTATSVGITARVLSDLNRLQEPESQIVLGAAVIDDVIGLVILAVVGRLTEGQEVTALGVTKITGIAFGFLVGTLLVGQASGSATGPLRQSSGLARHADDAGRDAGVRPCVAGICGGFSPDYRGVCRRASAAGDAQEHVRSSEGVAHLGHFFVPLFFVAVGAAVDVRVLNPFDPANHTTLLVGGLLIVAAVVGKFLAGYAPFWFPGNKKVIGVGMIPRGEVGLIFAQMGLASGVFDPGLFSAVTLMVMVTTFMAPPLLKMLLPAVPPERQPPEPEGIEDLATEP